MNIANKKFSWQQPIWDNESDFINVKKRLNRFLPLIPYNEITDIYEQLEQVWQRKAIILQAGDCAERISESNYSHVFQKIKFLHEMSSFLSKRVEKPVITVGRIAGQYTKPRSQQYEVYKDIILPVWRGDSVNKPELTIEARRNDPKRMILTYHAARKTLSSIHKYYNIIGNKQNSRIWTSHEALLLDYEKTQIRIAENSKQYLASTHWPWIGIRTLDINSPHISLLSKIDNPVACKIDNTITPSMISILCEKLNPNKIPGRLTFISRFGSKNIHKLGQLIDVVIDMDIPVLWMCDPMHGNTHKTSMGYKCRNITEIIAEVISFQTQVIERNACCAGIHLETTAENIAECFGSGYNPNEEELEKIICDPRLNSIQTLEVLSNWEGRF
ncbi:3-deoxy-7-phosphoheptulonate synthase [Xenorhabdus sp. SGI246]|uniref:3-deoxy-7-phosphoheptulonate synthase n=1 Tax=Xenorhabdus sp. SGI246 TaxID=3158263 RepID=UPI00349F3D4A